MGREKTSDGDGDEFVPAWAFELADEIAKEEAEDSVKEEEK